MRVLLEDLKHALRLYRRTPGASLVVIAVLAIGMAFVAAFVSLYVDLVLRPHPGFEDGGRLVSYGWTDGKNTGGIPADVVDRIAAESTTLAAVAATQTYSFLIGTEPTEGIGEIVTREFFSGVKPRLALGRGFRAEEYEPGADPVIVISHRYWQDAFDGRANILDTRVPIEAQGVLYTLNNQQQQQQQQPVFEDEESAEEPEEPPGFRIVGVMAPEYRGAMPPQQGSEPAFWIPLESALPKLIQGPPLEVPMMLAMLRSQWNLRGIALRRPKASAAAVARELDAGGYAKSLPNYSSLPNMRFDALDGLVFNANIQRSTTKQLRLFLGASVLLALVAAANVSLFLLARAPGRRRELAIRLSVGAPLRRLARQLATETALLVTVATALGLALSVWLAEYLRGLSFLRQAQWRDVTLLDWRVLALVGTFLALLTLLVSLAPVLGLKKLGIAASSRQISARASVAQRIAGTAQIAIAGVLGGAAVAFSWYLGSMLLAYPGYDTQTYAVRYQIQTQNVAPISSSGLNAQRGITAEAVGIMHTRAREAIATIPGVTAVALGNLAPGIQSGSSMRTMPNPHNAGQQLRVRTQNIDAQYVRVLGLRLRHGRPAGVNEPTAVVINQTFARQLFGRDNAVGERIVWNAQGTNTSEVVGVLADLSFEHPLAVIEPMAFMTPSALTYSTGLAFVKSRLSQARLQRELQVLVEEGRLEATIRDISALAALRHNVLAPDRARSFLTIATAVLVVLLAGFGFYGTQRYLVAAGRREYAIRASLGAGPGALGRLVIFRGLMLGLPGLAVGLPFAFILVTWLRDEYISRDISAAMVTLIVALGLLALLVVASIGPARRARSTQPAPLLRDD